MEEKNLLKEITYLSRLIGQHKSNLKSLNFGPPCPSQRMVNKVHYGHRGLQNTTREIPGKSSKAATSRYCKVNSVPRESIPRLKTCLTATTVSEWKISLNEQPVSAGISAASQNKSVSDMDELDPAVVSKKPPSCSSVHINPKFFKSKSSNQEPVSLRCKSVHINPKLLTVTINNTAAATLKDDDSKQMQVTQAVRSVVPLETNIARHPAPLNTPASHTSEKLAVAPLQAAPECASCTLVSMKTPNSRRKYLYRSKTKLVKATASAVNIDCKLLKKSAIPSGAQGAAKIIKTPHGSVLLAVSRTKLVRLPGKVRRSLSSKSDGDSSGSTVTKSRYRLRRASASGGLQSSTIRVARKVCQKYRSAVVVGAGVNSKYRLDRRLQRSGRKTRPQSGSSRYKVDHRTGTPSRGSSARSSRVRAHLLFSPNRRSSFSSRIWLSAASPLAVQKVAISHKRLSRIGCNPGTRNYEQNSALVRIGGLLYKTSRTKLVLSKTPEKSTNINTKPRTIVKRRSLNSGGHVVYVRGNKFVMDRTGKTLRRATEGRAPSVASAVHKRQSRVSRVDIGGVTYIQKTPTVLVRTNTHTARNVVSYAKQRSIAVLARKMRKNNTPCLFYRRFGRCPRQEKGCCELVHDPKYIDICKKFLQGKCSVDGCLLSHDVGPEKMPTCRFFLEGCCVRDTCPYLHVKVNDRAPICRSFLQGYCADGPECLKRHIKLCPEFDKNGVCPKGKYCPHPHTSALRVQRTLCTDPPITMASKGESPASLKRKRYYETDPVLEDHSQDSQSDLDTSCDDALDRSAAEEDCPATLKKRPKIGELPSFIALESADLE